MHQHIDIPWKVSVGNAPVPGMKGTFDQFDQFEMNRENKKEVRQGNQLIILYVHPLNEINRK